MPIWKKSCSDSHNFIEKPYTSRNYWQMSLVMDSVASEYDENNCHDSSWRLVAHGTVAATLFDICIVRLKGTFRRSTALNVRLHNFFSGSFDPISEPDVCARGTKPNLPYAIGGVRDIMQPNVQCCASTKGPFQTYNANIKQCCSDGSVRDQSSWRIMTIIFIILASDAVHY
jgi:hypothetical protein